MDSTKTDRQEHQDLSYMLTTPIPRLVARMAVPTVITMLVTSVYGLADMFFVSELGTSASAAVGIVLSIMTMIQAVGFMLGMGAGSLISRRLGEGKDEEADGEIPEELLETEEDRETERREAEKNAKFEKISNYICIAAMLAAFGYVIYRIFLTFIR